MAIPVTATWKSAIQAQFRNAAYMKLDLSIVAPGLREGATATTDATEAMTSTAALLDGVQDDVEPVASFELNRWIGNGKMYLPSENYALNKPMGWWCNDCNFTSISFLFVFDKTYDIPGLYAVWDTETNSWPTHVQLDGYGASDELLGTYTITNLDSVSGYTDAPFTAAKSIVMTITGWSKAQWRVRITEIMFGVYLSFTNKTLKEASIEGATSILASELPKLTASFTINNYDRTFDPTFKTGYSKYLRARQLMTIQFGFETSVGNIEWLEPWPTYLNAWKIPTDSPQVLLETVSRLSFLTSVYKAGMYTGATKTFATMATTVLENSGILKITDSEIPWELDSVLSTLSTKAPEPLLAINSILQLIANATGCYMDIDPSNNWIRLRSAFTSADYTIGKMQQIGDPAFGKDDDNNTAKLKSVSVYLYSYVAKAAAEQVYSFEGTLSGTQTLEVNFSNKAIVTSPSVTVTGATVSNQTFYARCGYLTVVAPEAGATVTIKITGTVIEVSKTLLTVYNDTSIVSGRNIVIDNELITETATATAAANASIGYYLQPTLIDVPYLGYPELETGDELAYVTNYGNFQGDLVGTKLKCNGGFSGTLTTRMREDDA